MKPIQFFFLLIVLAGAGCENPQPEERKIILLDKNDPQLVYAKKQASETLDSFISSFSSLKGDSSYFFSVKKEFGDDNERSEHMWVEVFDVNEEGFIGLLGNEPGIINTFKFGDTVRVKKDEVEDWMIYDQAKDTILGAFTVRVLGRNDLLD
ncbi:MAG: DUF2314 domain-containing protein [Cytophagaceae bacterium]